ncbi:MAG: PQQ-binding-like beta-propeller repeat protein [Acidobacteria bacterium]|nr:PQQ-binding-like beta-propeller repeat protein [Acidobacteriota bacterium]
MSTLCPELESIRKVIDLSILLRHAGLVCALVLVSPTVHGQEIAWPQFRGPDSNPVGAHSRLAERWSKTENVEWSQEIPGRGWSSPIVTGGKVEWKREFYTGQPPGGRHRKNSFVSESPVTDGKFVYVYVANLGLWAIDLKGKMAWTTPLEANPIYLDLGTGSSPALTGNLLVIVNDNEKQQYIAAFDKQTGKQVWRSNRDIGGNGEPVQRSGWATPFVWRHALRTEIVAVGPGEVVSYDLAGKELWRMSGMAATPIPMPFANDGLLYIDGGRGRPLFALRPGAAGDISLGKDQTSNEYVVWSQARGGTYLPTPVAYDGAVYALTETGILSRFDAKTGEMTYRTRIDPAATAFTTSPWAYNGKLFCLSEEGQTFVIAAGEKFQLLHVNALDEMAQASPALVGERLLVRTEHRLYSIRRQR